MDAGVQPNIVSVEAHSAQGAREDVECLKTRIDAAEQRRLDELQIPVVAGRQLLGDVQYFMERRLRHGTAPAHQLEHVGIALLRHDRGARGESFRQTDETVFLCVEEQQVGGEPSHILREQCDLEEQLRFGFAS